MLGWYQPNTLLPTILAQLEYILFFILDYKRPFLKKKNRKKTLNVNTTFFCKISRNNISQKSDAENLMGFSSWNSEFLSYIKVPLAVRKFLMRDILYDRYRYRFSFWVVISVIPYDDALYCIVSDMMCNHFNIFFSSTPVLLILIYGLVIAYVHTIYVNV